MPERSAAQGHEACTRCGATPETGQGEDCMECQGIVGPLCDRQPYPTFEKHEQAAWEEWARILHDRPRGRRGKPRLIGRILAAPIWFLNFVVNGDE